MPARRREATPPSKAERAELAGAMQRPAVQVANVEPRPAHGGMPRRTSAGHGRRRDGHVRRRCTDMFCVLVFVAFNSVLVGLARHGWEAGDMRRLSHGFDYTGRMCAVGGHPNRTAGGEEELTGGEFVYWCSTQLGPGQVEVQWDKPVCVTQCPRGEEKIRCPLSSSERDAGKSMPDGVDAQGFAPRPTVRTRRISNFCFPLDFGPQALVNLPDRSSRSWSDMVLQAGASFWQLQDAPRLISLVLLVSFVAGLLWVAALHFCSLIMAHLSFMAVIATTLAFGLAIMLMPYADEIGLTSISSGSQEPLSRALSAASRAGVLRQVAQWARHFRFLHPVLDLPNAHFIFGVSVLAVGFGLLVKYVYSHRSVSLTANSMRQGCQILLRHPTLLVGLPLMELASMALVVAASAAGLALTCSTLEVQAETVQVLGENVAGVYRSFVWNQEILSWSLVWVVAMLWYLDLVTAVRSYVISYIAAKHYFSGGQACRAQTPIRAGGTAGLCYHFGSLVFGALCMATLRAARVSLWLLSFLLSILPEQRERKWRLVRWTLGALDMAVAFIRSELHRVSEHAYTEILLSSTPFCTAAPTSSNRMLRNSSLVWFQTVILRPMLFLGAVILSMGLGVAIWLALLHMPPALGKLFPPLAAVFVEAQAVNAGIVGMLGAIMSFSVVRTFSDLVNLTSDAVLYCYLWEKESGATEGRDALRHAKD